MLPDLRKWLCTMGIILAAQLAGCATPAAKPSGWFGLNTQLGQSANTSETDHQIDFDLIAELNVHLIRDGVMSWARVQPTPDAPYDFSLSDALVRHAQAGHVQVLAVCAGIPHWAAAQPGVPAREHTEAFQKFVHDFVERYDGDGRDDMPGLKSPVEAYEFMSEMENVPTDEYAYWLKLFYETVKACDAKATVVLGSLRSPGIKLVSQTEGEYHTYLERLLNEPTLAGSHFPYCDVVAFHNDPTNYPGRSEFDDALAYLRKTMAAHQLALPIWLTEYGSNGGPQEEDRQKDNIVRWAIRARALGIDRVYLFCLSGGNRSLVREVENGQVPLKKPAFRAVQILLEELEKRPRVARRADGVYVLTGKGEPAYVIWKEDSYDNSAVRIPGWWEVRTLTGKTTTRQGSTIDLTGTPLFLHRVASPFIK